MCDDIQNCCRICLDVKSDHVSILGDPTIHLHIKSCLALDVSPNDGLPKDVCKSCVSQLCAFYNFQLNARCSQDWLETSIQEKSKKEKTHVQPLPDSEYNSDSLLEFLNNTANIEEYLNNLGKEDIPSIVNLLDRNENASKKINENEIKKTKPPTPKKKMLNPQKCLNMEIDVLDSDIDVVKEILMKETPNTNKKVICFGCKAKLDNVHKLSQHMSICDIASRMCIICNTLFDSRQKMLNHNNTHKIIQNHTVCYCGKEILTKEQLQQHRKVCIVDSITTNCVYRCKQCDQLFNDRYNLYKHVKLHIIKSDERICDICGHGFNGNDALIEHKKKEHEKAEHLSYRCKVCKFTSSDRKEIYLHVQKHTEIQEPSRHLCESCGRSFTSRSTLIRHSAKHEMFKCNICEKSFTGAKSRDEHLTEHITLIMCDRCGDNVNSYDLDFHKCG